MEHTTLNYLKTLVLNDVRYWETMLNDAARGDASADVVNRYNQKLAVAKKARAVLLREGL